VELVAGASATPEELLEFAREKIAERAALPKYIEILKELPKTAVGKVFKPDLRRQAIRRVFDEALESNGVSARVSDVIEDKKRGLVARISGRKAEEEQIVTKVLGEFPGHWDWKD
jgi:fatty-acyl-CoA synthase